MSDTKEITDILNESAVGLVRVTLESKQAQCNAGLQIMRKAIERVTARPDSVIREQALQQLTSDMRDIHEECVRSTSEIVRVLKKVSE